MNFTRTDGRLDANIAISDGDIEQALRRPPSFAWFGGPETFAAWSLGPVIRRRESDLLGLSNAAALVTLLKSDSTLHDEWRLTECSHWAVSWVQHVSYRAIADDGTPTRAFRVIWEFFRSLKEDYPIANDDDLRQREEADTVSNIGVEGRRLVTAEAPGDWADQVYSWLVDNDESAVQPRDGWGGLPAEGQIRAALAALHLLQDERKEVSP